VRSTRVREREHDVRVALAMRNAAARSKLARPSVAHVRCLGNCLVASVRERAGCLFASRSGTSRCGANRNGRATSSAAPRVQSGARHGLGTLARAEDRHVMALRAIRGRLSVAPSNRVRGGSREVLGSLVPGRLAVNLGMASAPLSPVSVGV
jgi:hypothetical protein